MADRPEEVVLLDEEGRPTGRALKSEVHTADTPFHLAFSCYAVGPSGKLLITRRALSKPTWPGVWTNSFCGHPSPDEDLANAVERRAIEELGVAVRNVECVLPDFRYRAVDAGGTVENELCPVFIAELEGPVAPDPSEVAEWSWISPLAFARAVALAPFAFSPWVARQLPQLESLGVLTRGRAA